MLHHARCACLVPGRAGFCQSPVLPGLLRDIFLQILMKECHILQAVLVAHSHRLSPPARRRLYPHNTRRFTGQRQREIAHAAEEIKHAVGRLDIQPRQRGFDHLLINTVINPMKSRGLNVKRSPFDAYRGASPVTCSSISLCGARKSASSWECEKRSSFSRSF